MRRAIQRKPRPEHPLRGRRIHRRGSGRTADGANDALRDADRRERSDDHVNRERMARDVEAEEQPLGDESGEYRQPCLKRRVSLDGLSRRGVQSSGEVTEEEATENHAR